MKVALTGPEASRRQMTGCVSPKPAGEGFMYLFESFIIVVNCTGTSSFFLNGLKYHSSCISLAFT